MTLSSPYPLFVELRDHSQTLTGVLAFRTTSMSKGGETERVTGVPVSVPISTYVGAAVDRDSDHNGR